MTINIARDFSKFPAGRVAADGPDNAQRFRQEMLLPFLNLPIKIFIEVDGTLGYASSFIEEAFSGLAKEAGITQNDLVNKIKIVASNPILASNFYHYINQ